MKSAIIKEIDKAYLDAVKSYEDEIGNNDYPASLDTYINLVFLYWSFAFERFEFNIPNNIPEDWSVIGGKRYPKILELGLNCYPHSVELHFWKKYFLHIGFGEDFSEKDCKQLLEQYGDVDSTAPYFFLYLFDKEKYKDKKKVLIDECNQLPIAKNLYIKSVLN